MKKYNPWIWLTLWWLFFILHILTSCDVKQEQHIVPRGTLPDTTYGILTFWPPIRVDEEPWSQLGARIDEDYWRITITKTNTQTRSYVDTAWFTLIPKHLVVNFKPL